MSTKGVIVALALGLACLCGFGCGSASPRFRGSEPDQRASTTGDLALRGIASYYAEEFDGRRTSNGEKYDMHALTAAHRDLPFNTRVLVKNLNTNQTVIVRINDRGPFKDDRIIDLSFEAAKELGIVPDGTAPVELVILELGQAHD